jgi:hypothetical protein
MTPATAAPVTPDPETLARSLDALADGLEAHAEPLTPVARTEVLDALEGLAIATKEAGIRCWQPIERAIFRLALPREVSGFTRRSVAGDLREIAAEARS